MTIFDPNHLTFKIMEPIEELSEGAKAIFHHLVKCMPNENVLIETDSYGLSMLANAYHVNFRCIEAINACEDITQIKAQVTTLHKQTADYITKNAPSYGGDPKSRESMKEVWAKKENNKSGLAATMGIPSNANAT